MKHWKVLLVEYNEELRRLYRETFRRNNFTVIESSDGQSAIDQALLHLPDLILLDLMLPRQGGIRALRVFRTLPECKPIPIIILTALPDPKYKEQTENLVQGYYLKTEITPKDLVTKVRQLLDQ